MLTLSKLLTWNKHMSSGVWTWYTCPGPVTQEVLRPNDQLASLEGGQQW